MPDTAPLKNRRRLHAFLCEQVGGDKIAIINFGSQYTRLIARKVRELGVYSEIYSAQSTTQQLLDFAPRAIILSGGPESVDSHSAPEVGFDLQALNVPTLGICYGMQWLARQYGGKTKRVDSREFGSVLIDVQGSSALFDGMQADCGAKHTVWMSHGDSVVRLPSGFSAIAETEYTPIAAMADESRSWYGLQFHPEVTHTVCGTAILNNFIHKIARCSPSWQPANIIARSVDSIRRIVGDEHVLLALSGGVDSSVAALLLQQAIGKKLHCIFVDNGLLRAGERAQVVETFERHFGVD